MSAGDAEFDIVIVGAGPAGLCFTASLRDAGLRVALIERLESEALAEPAYDGREIALTLKSVATLRTLGLWSRLGAGDTAELHAARVFNGESLRTLDLRPPEPTASPIGYLVSNHLIRRAAYQAAREVEGVSWFTGTRVAAVSTDPQGACIELADGRRLRARLIVAADSRFSETRRALGIAASMRDFGKSMMVCRMRHAVPHQRTAWEWFGHHQTLALLPLNGDCSSVVLTLPHVEIARLQQLAPEAFAAEMAQRFLHRLGTMTLDSERFVYPLVAVYANQFVANRYAAIGDAAVGMHPVTAHGFNFGLLSQATLSGLVNGAHRQGADIASSRLLHQYERTHRHATLPLYLATNAIVRLYTDESMPARIARDALLNIAHALPPVGAVLSRLLMQPATRGRGLMRLLPH